MPSTPEFGDKLRTMRQSISKVDVVTDTRRHLRQEELAAVIHCDTTLLARWESGERQPQPAQLVELVKYFAGRTGCLETPEEALDWADLLGKTLTKGQLVKAFKEKFSPEEIEKAVKAFRLRRVRVQRPPDDREDEKLAELFTDRDELKSLFTDLVLGKAEEGERPTKNILIVEGEEGVGKSVLLRIYRLICWRQKIPVSLINTLDINQDEAVRDVLATIHRDWSRLGVQLPQLSSVMRDYSDLQTKIRLDEALSPEEKEFYGQADERLTTAFLTDLPQAAARQRLVLLWDHYDQDKVADTMDEWLHEIAVSLHYPKVLIVVAAREFFWNTRQMAASTAWRRRAHLKRLEPLSTEDAAELAKRYCKEYQRSVPDTTRLEALIAHARGLPSRITKLIDLMSTEPEADVQTPQSLASPEVVDARKRFVGRQTETDSFKKILSDDQSILYSIWGPPGVGKTWLLEQVRDICERNGYRYAKIDFRTEQHEPASVLTRLADQLSPKHFELFRQDLKAHDVVQSNLQSQFKGAPRDIRDKLAPYEKNYAQSFVAGLMTLAWKKKVVLFCDTFENAESSDLAEWLRDRVLGGMATGHLRNLVVVIAGWHQIDWRGSWQNVISSCELKEFTAEDEVRQGIAKVLEVTADSINADLVTAVHKFTEGYPQAVGLAAELIKQTQKAGDIASLEWFSQHKTELGRESVLKILVERLLKRGVIPSDVAQAIPVLAIPRWFDTSVFRALQPNEPQPQDIIDQIQRFSSLVRPREPRGYEFHQFIRRLLLRRMYRDDPVLFTAMNQRAAQYNGQYLGHLTAGSGQDDAQLEGFLVEKTYHELLADLQGTSAASIIETLVDDYIDRYRLGICQNILRAAQDDQEFLHEHTANWLLYLDGRIRAARTSWEDAKDPITELLKQQDIPSILRANGLYVAAHRAAYSGHFAEGINLFEQALQLLEPFGEEVNRKRALILAANGDAYGQLAKGPEAVRYRDQALVTARKTSDADLTAGMLHAIGGAHDWTGQFDLAYEMFVESLDLTRRSGNEYLLLRSLIWLSLAEIHLRKYPEARQHLEEAIEKGKKIDLQQVAWAHRHMGFWHFDQGDYEQAVDCFRESLSLYEQRGATRGTFRALVILANALVLVGRLDEVRAMSAKIKKWEDEVNLLATICEWRVIEGHLSLDDAAKVPAALSMAIGKYQEALLIAVHQGRNMLDRTITNITSHLRRCAQSLGQDRVCSVVDALIAYWCSTKVDERALPEIEKARRDEAVGDGRPQKPVLEYLSETRSLVSG